MAATAAASTVNFDELVKEFQKLQKGEFFLVKALIISLLFRSRKTT